MTEKRFKIVDEQFISYYGGTGHKISNEECGFWLWHNKNESQKVCDKLNSILDENEELKQREETLLCEIEDFQELLAKNEGVCHKRVIDLIDDRIFNFSNVKEELLLHSDDDYRLEKLSFAIQNLRELKKELSE